MPGRRAEWLPVLFSVALMAGLVTAFQLALPRPRAEWIAASLAQHDLLMRGAAGSPWQYRPLSDYAIQGLFDLLGAARVRDPFTGGPYLVGFLLFRGAQALAIFGLGFIYYRRLGFGRRMALAGLAVLCATTLLAQVNTNWRLDTYTEVLLYLAAGWLLLVSRLWPIVALAPLAVLNRETGFWIALMPLVLVNGRAWRARENGPICQAVGLALLLAVLARAALLLWLPSQDLSTRVLADTLVGNFRNETPYPELAVVGAVLPLVAAAGLPMAGPFLARLFWLIVPLWVAIHAWGNPAVAPMAFLTPAALVFVPCALRLGEALTRKRDFAWADVAVDRQALAALATVYLLGPVLAAIGRLPYPYQLERIEPAVLQEVRRILAGGSPYAAPSLEYVPTLYAPLYFYLSAALAALTGPTFLPLRLVSLAAALGSAAIIFRLVSRDAPGRFAGFLSAALFLGTSQFSPVDRYPARVDQLCLLLVLLAIGVARDLGPGARAVAARGALCGALVGLAILTKQTAAVVAIALLAFLAIPPGIRALSYVVGLAATLAVATALLAASSGPWAWFYVASVPRNHGLDWTRLVGFWTDELLPHFGPVVPFAALVLVLAWIHRDRSTVRLYACAVAGLVGMGWAAALNVGGGENSMPPAYAGLALLFGLGFQAVIRRCQSRRLPAPRVAPFAAFGVAALALAALEYSPADPDPLSANVRAGQRLVQAIGDLPGPVLAPDLGDFQRQAGKGEQAYTGNYLELLGFYGGVVLPEGRAWLEDLDAALSSRRYAYVLVDPEGFDTHFPTVLACRGYRRQGPLFAAEDPFFRWAVGRTGLRGGRVTPSPDVYVPGDASGTATPATGTQCPPPGALASLYP